MDVEERLKSKRLYKLELIGIKYIPIIIALLYFVDTILDALEIELDVLSHLFGMSFLPWCFFLLSSVVFRFCLFHRLPLYYIAINHIISMIDYYIGIPIDLKGWIVGHICLLFIFIIWMIVEHQKTLKND